MKEKIRKELLGLRRGFERKDLEEMSSKVRKNLESMPEFRKARTIFFYVSLEDEVETHSLIKDSIKKGKKVIIPYLDEKEIFLSELKDFKELEKGRFGVLEPKKESIRKADISHADLIIVPGIAFTKQGHRLGFGKGYYDRLLVKSEALKAALCFSFQIIDEIPVEEHDIPVDVIVTEKEIIRI